MTRSRSHSNANDNGQLEDVDLRQREASERRELRRLRDHERHLDDTTFGSPPASGLLLHAWQRWSRTLVDLVSRGLKPLG